jgi:putative membrane protein
MRFEPTDHVPELAGVLSVVSLALVFGAALQVLPVGALPRAPPTVFDAIPHVNAAISVVAVVVIAAGWRAIRRGNVERHRGLMVSGFLLFGAFLVLYLYKVALVGPKGFPEAAPGWVETFVYYPVLGLHMLLAVVCVPLLFYVLLLAVTRPVSEIPLTDHPRFGRVTAALWLTSFVLGTVVYLLLYVAF